MRKKRASRLVNSVRAELRRSLEQVASVPDTDRMQQDISKVKAHETQRHFDDIVGAAESAQEVITAFRSLPPGTNLTCEMRRAIDARYKRLEQDMGFATSGMRRMVCLGALCMSAVGLTLAVSGLHLGALSLACGASVLALFIVAALLTYAYRCVLYRYTDAGKIALTRHRAVLSALRQLCDEQRIMPDDPCRVTLDRSRSIINGHIGFVALEVMRGTILEPAVSAIDMGRRRVKTWRLRRRLAASSLPEV